MREASPKTAERSARRRGRSPAKTASTRRAILDAARRLFLERGLSATRVIDVADRASLAKGTVYLHFADKDALVEAVLREAIGAPLARLRLEPIGDDESVKAFLRRAALPFLQTVESEGVADLIRLVIRESATFPPLRRIYRSMVIDPMSAFLRRLAERAAARREARSDGLERFPLLLIAPALLATLWNGLAEQDQQQMSAAQAFDAFLDLVFA